MKATSELAAAISGVINQSANELAWFQTPIQELQWVIEDRLTGLDLKRHQIELFISRKTVRQFRINFHLHGVAARPEQIDLMLATAEMTRQLERYARNRETTTATPTTENQP